MSEIDYKSKCEEFKKEVDRLNKLCGRLQERDEWLSALEVAGVDNWGGWNQAVDIMKEWNEESDDDNE